jgi:hypothetical protein
MAVGVKAGTSLHRRVRHVYSAPCKARDIRRLYIVQGRLTLRGCTCSTPVVCPQAPARASLEPNYSHRGLAVQSVLVVLATAYTLWYS